MCNLYDVGPAPNQARASWEESAREALAKLLKPYNLRKTDPGLVVRVGEESRAFEPTIMRWGFAREFNPAVNNARAEKLRGGMWRKAFQERRCLIPVAAFYEWTGPKGRKQTHVIRREDGAWMWMAGLWEMHREHGLCYSMITTAAAPWIAGIHERMPAVFPTIDAAEHYLAGDDTSIEPLEEPMPIVACENPLRFKIPGPPRSDGLGL
jgi:putative SOS response-associated peptidase YedK